MAVETGGCESWVEGSLVGRWRAAVGAANNRLRRSPSVPCGSKSGRGETSRTRARKSREKIALAIHRVLSATPRNVGPSQRCAHSWYRFKFPVAAAQAHDHNTAARLPPPLSRRPTLPPCVVSLPFFSSYRSSLRIWQSYPRRSRGRRAPSPRAARCTSGAPHRPPSLLRPSPSRWVRACACVVVRVVRVVC